MDINAVFLKVAATPSGAQNQIRAGAMCEVRFAFVWLYNINDYKWN